MNVTVDSLIQRSLSVADMPNSTFITTRDQHDAVNEGYRGVYNDLLNSDDDFYVTAVTPTVTGTYTLPSDFMRLRAVDVNSGGIHTECLKFTMNQRNMMQGASTDRPWYRLQGNTLYLIPQDIAFTLRVWYYPTPVVLVAASVQPWVTTTAYKQGDIVIESSNAYACIVSHTSGTFATDLTNGKWYLYADAVSATNNAITYPNNLVQEIISYGSAMKFKSKAREPEKAALIQKDFMDFQERFRTQIRRDDANYEKIEDYYSQGNKAWL